MNKNEKEDMMVYCPKCGNIGGENDICNFCGTKEIVTPYSWDKWLYNGGYDFDPSKKILEEYVKPNPLFDEELYNKRVGVEKAQQQATLDMMRMEKQQAQRANVPKCPTCGSTNVERISTAQKAFGFALVGLFSSNLGKTMHCKNCGYKW